MLSEQEVLLRRAELENGGRKEKNIAAGGL